MESSVGITGLAAIEIEGSGLQQRAAPQPTLGNTVEVKIRRRLPVDGEYERW